MKDLTMQTVIDFKFKGSSERKALSDIYNEDVYGSQEEFFAFIEAWIQTGRAKIVDSHKSKEEEMADAIAQELMAVQKAKTIEQDREDRVNY